MAPMNQSDKKMKIQGMMNRLIYWLDEELEFAVIYQCHHCCMLLLVRREKKRFLFGKVLFLLYKIYCVIISM